MSTVITEVQIVPVKPNNGLVGFASLVVDGKLYLGSIAIFTKINGDGYRITFPTKTAGSRELQIFHPINKEIYEAIESAVLTAAKNLFERSNASYDRFSKA